MALPVPPEPKVYTTKYSNWRGVDYTNDASNVWYRRSPQGVNMLPNLDGQPFKRNGWKIEFAPADFCAAAGISPAVDVVQYKVDYFELGGAEYLWFYTSIGCFYYVDELTYVDKSYEIDDPDGYKPSAVTNERVWYYRSKWKYEVGDLCFYTTNNVEKFYRCNTKITTPEAFNASHWTEITADECWKSFPPTRSVDGVDVPCDIDYTKSFFFEGQGRAAYYLFCDDKMYWFDGEKLHETHPHFPIVLTMCDNKGVGTALESVNLLTHWRCIEYTCAEGSTEYTIPDGFDEIFGVYTHQTGKYEWNMTEQWDVGQNAGTIVMRSVPPETFNGQVNLRIIYRPAGATIQERANIYTPSGKLQIKKTTVKTQKQIYVNHAWQNYGNSTTKSTYANITKPTFSLSNPKKPLSTYVLRQVKDANGNWQSSTVGRTFNSYGNKVTLGSSDGGKAMFDAWTSIKAATTTKTTYSAAHRGAGVPIVTRTVTTTTTSTKTFEARIVYTQWNYTPPADFAAMQAGREAFFAASKALLFGNGIINQAFLTASTKEKFNTRVWYSAATNPYYFPDTNYIEVGSTDKPVMGLIKVGDYLGVIKQGDAVDTSVYLAYPTSFENITTYAVKQSVNGIGAISNGAFNILNDESLFLSNEGVMGIEPTENEDRKLRNRSYYINKKLREEPALESAISFVYKGMYWLCVNNHCYVLDGSQKSSWENTKTNLQYECYYLENIPAKCFAKKDGLLWFIDTNGNVCRFREDSDRLRYVDAYDASKQVQLIDVEPQLNEDGTYRYEQPIDTVNLQIVTRLLPIDSNVTFTIPKEGNNYIFTGCTVDFLAGGEKLSTRDVTPDGIVDDGENVTVTFISDNDAFIDPPEDATSANIRINWLQSSSRLADISKGELVKYGNVIYSVVDSMNQWAATLVEGGVPIKAVWGTIADDDGSAHYYKKLQKKGSLVALMPMSDSGVKAWVVKDEEEPIFVGETDAQNHILPFNYYLRKKVKKYKRLQIIVENDSYNDGFGVDEIIKCYTVGNYAKK